MSSLREDALTLWHVYEYEIQNSSDALCLPAAGRPDALCVFGKGNGKGASLIQPALGRDVTAVTPGNSPRKAKAQANAGLAPALVTAVESLKDTREIAWRDAHARIFDGENDLCVVLRNGNINRPSGWGVFDGIVYKVGEHPLKHPDISGKMALIGYVAGQAYPLILSSGLKEVACLPDKACHVDLFTGELSDARLRS